MKKINILERFEKVPKNSYYNYFTTEGVLCLWNHEGEKRVGIVNSEAIVNHTFTPTDTNFQWMTLKLWKHLHQIIFTLDGYDVREEWFMQQHFSKEELQQLFEWERKSGRVTEVKASVKEGFSLYHIEDVEGKIELCYMKEEYMLRRWAERLGYKMKDRKTSLQFEEEHGIKDLPIEIGEEVFREGRTTVTKYKNKFHIVSGDFGLVTKRTASNAIEILLLNSEEYNEYLKNGGK